MKKILIIFIPILFLGCNNYYENEASIEVKTNLHKTRAIDELGEITSLELWISDVGVDYKVDNPDETQLYEQYEDSEIDLDSTVVRYLTSTTNSINFDIRVGVTKMFTLRVTYDDDRVFIGSTQRVISIYSSIIELEAYETATSLQNAWFSDFDEFLDEFE